MSPLLRAAIEQCLVGVDRRAVAQAARELSDAYRAAPDHPVVRLDAHARLAYLATRFPATLAALRFAARELAGRLDLSSVEELLELGAGPGPARFATAGLLPALARVHQVDRDAGLLELGRRLEAGASDAAPGVRLTQEVADLAHLDPLPPADLVVISYALGEVRPDRRDAVVDRAWQAARLALIVVEPGTMPGTARVLQARARLLDAGAHVVAPCPHEQACPLTAPGWCHVPVRLERSRLHQQLKGVSVGFEDEKVAYLAVARHAVTRPAARVVAQPEVHKGHVRLHVCTAAGIEDATVARRHGDAYRRARHARWGEGLDAPLP